VNYGILLLLKLETSVRREVVFMSFNQSVSTLSTMPKYFHHVTALANEDGRNDYIYKKGSECETYLRLSHEPKTAEEFYQLGKAIRDGLAYFGEEVVIDSQKTLINNPQARFSNNLFIEAAMAGHAGAGRELVLKKFSCKGEIDVWLPAIFKTPEELYQLAVHLKTQGGKGHYYRVDTPAPDDANTLREYANRLSDNLLEVVARMHNVGVTQLSSIYADYLSQRRNRVFSAMA